MLGGRKKCKLWPGFMPDQRQADSGSSKATPTFDDSNKIVEEKLRDNLTALESRLGGDCLTYVGPIMPGADDEIRDAIEAGSTLCVLPVQSPVPLQLPLRCECTDRKVQRLHQRG
jgi:hypothetical protein